MRKGLGYFLFLVKMENLGRQTALRASVVESDAVYAKQCRYQFKVQIGDELQRFSPISANCRFAAQGSAGLIGQLNDVGRSHDKVVGIVGQDPRQIVAVSRVYPVAGKMFGKSVVHGRFLFITSISGRLSNTCSTVLFSVKAFITTGNGSAQIS